MNDKVEPALLDIANRHLERASRRAITSQVKAHEVLDGAIGAARHDGRVTALHEAITAIRKIADEWADTANEYGSLRCPVNDAVEQTYNENAKRLNDLAFQLLSKVDES